MRVRLSRVPRFLGAMTLLLLCHEVSAHALAPVLIQITQSSESEFQVIWRSALSRPVGQPIEPEWPIGCEIAERQAPNLASDKRAIESSAKLLCVESPFGKQLRVRDLDRLGISVILRIENLVGEVSELSLDARRPVALIPHPTGSLDRAVGYLKLGVEHLLAGLDHLLFITGMVLLVPKLIRLLITISAFTVGHSVSLAAVSLGLLTIPQGPVEILIALSLIPMALEILRPQASAWRDHLPWLAVIFGLIHGLGFAGVLAEIGLPPSDIIAALLAFNLGIELGQVLVVIAVLLILAAIKLIPTSSRDASPPTIVRNLMAYLIGSAACFWVIDRGMGLATLA